MDSKVFLEKVAAYRSDGWRLAVINATAVLPGPEYEEGAVDVSWSFERGGCLEHLRERLKPGEGVPSISPVYGSAFLYENELRELFGVGVTGLTVDFAGSLYRTAERVPFSPKAIRARLDAKGKKP